MLGELTIDYAERKVMLAGEPVPLVPMEYRLLAELAAHAGSVLTHQHLLATVWSDKNKGDTRPVRSAMIKLRRKLADDADNPTYIFTEPRVGCRMAMGDTAGDEQERGPGNRSVPAALGSWSQLRCKLLDARTSPPDAAYAPRAGRAGDEQRAADEIPAGDHIVWR